MDRFVQCIHQVWRSFGGPKSPLPAYDLNSAYYPGPKGPGYAGSGVYMQTPNIQSCGF